MDLLEAQGKALYKQYGLPTPESVLVATAAEAEKASQKFNKSVLKAQIPIGHRKKLGAIVMVTPKTAHGAASKLFKKVVKGYPIHQLLVEDFTELAEEWYLSLSIDRVRRGITVLFSRSGGIDIESVPKSKLHFSPYPLTDTSRAELRTVLGKQVELAPQLEQIISTLGKLMQERDAVLVEVNPLALTKSADGKSGRLLLLDSKITIDDSALFRQKFVQPGTPEKKATPGAAEGLAYVPLDGTIGLIGNGAGLVIATLDMVAQMGGKAANFLDVGGGADHARMEAALGIVLKQPSVKAVLINIFGGITRTDEIALGLEQFLQKPGNKEAVKKTPIVVRLVGIKMPEAREILKRNGILALDSMEDAVKQVVAASKGASQGRVS